MGLIFSKKQLNIVAKNSYGLEFRPAQSLVKVIALHSLHCQFAVEVIEFIKAGCESGHHMAAWTLPLLTIDVVTQSIIKSALNN